MSGVWDHHIPAFYFHWSKNKLCLLLRKEIYKDVNARRQGSQSQFKNLSGTVKIGDYFIVI